MNRWPRPSNLTWGAIVVAVGLVALAAGYVSAGQEHSTPIDAGSGLPPAPTRGVVQSLTSDSLTLATDGSPRSFRLALATQIEALRPSSLDALQPGDWVNAGALPHAQTLFALTGLVLLPQGSFVPPR